MLLQAALLLAAVGQAYHRDKNVFVEINGVAFYTHEDGPDLAHEIPKGCGRCTITIRKDAADYVVNFKRWYGQMAMDCLHLEGRPSRGGRSGRAFHGGI